MNAGQSKISQDFKSSITDQSNNYKTQETDEGNQMDAQSKNEAIPDNKNKRSQLEKRRQIISARQLQKLDKDDSLVFLAIVTANYSLSKRYRRRGERSQSHAAKFAAAHGITKGQKRQTNKQTSPKKDFISVEKGEQQVLASVLERRRKGLELLINEYRAVFPEKLAKDVPPSREVQHVTEIEPGSKPSY